MTLCYGKTPARPDAVKLKFSQAFNETELPKPPAVFGHEALKPDNIWFMFGNDQYGDCVLAGAAHEHMLWTLEGGLPRAPFTTNDVLSDYSAVTGFSKYNPFSDMGTDAQIAAAYRQKTGIRDANNVRHKIDAYSALRVGDTDQLALATWLFGAVGVGIYCPSSMQKQFLAGQTWTIVDTDVLEGGHYAPCVGRNSAGNFVFITWGRLQAATPEWVQKYMDEGIAYLSLEIINNSTKLSPESFNADALTQYLKGMT